MKIDITERTFKFGVAIIKFANKLPKSPAGRRISGQAVGSGTSIGANIQEAQNSRSKKEFISKCCIALNEARETLYWLRMVDQSNLVGKSQELENLLNESDEIIKILVTIIKNSKNNI